MVAILALTACSPHPPAPNLTFADLDGHDQRLTALKGRPAILVFWRSDCGPCVVELQGMRALEAAARPAPLVIIALQDRASAAAFFDRSGERPHMAWVAKGDATQVLVAFNGPPPRLPLAVALDARGDVCDRHVGLLGTDRASQWARQCS